MTETSHTPRSTSREPLSVWELPRLLQSVHTYRQQSLKTPRDRPHFPAIIAFVYRNRFVVASQIQRRFSQLLPSGRTTRRHLQEMETLKYIDTVPGPSPLWPKTYFVTRRGTRKLRDAFAAKGKAWKPTLIDRSRGNGLSTNHVLHELFVTELLLTQWEAVQEQDDLELVTLERRSLARHPAFRITMAGRPTRLVPDAMLLLRYAGKGMMCWFIEMDMGTTNEQQWQLKLRRYQVWSQTEAGNQWLRDTYRSHGAKTPHPVFRILTVANTEQRKSRLVEWSQGHHRRTSRLRFMCVADFDESVPSPIPAGWPTIHATTL